LCFVAGTPVSTPTGIRPIEALNIGDLVFTETGAYPIIATMSSMSDTVRLTVNTGEIIVTTPNHPFKVCDAWIRAEDLLHKNLTVKSISYLQKRNTSKELNTRKSKYNIFTELFGSITTELFLKVFMFITKMRTEATIQSKISNACHPEIILKNTGMLDQITAKAKKTFSIFSKCKNLLNCGIAQKQAGLGTKNTISCKKISHISSAGRNKVYNITVSYDHTYFVNDILVSNCDAFLYAWRNGYHYHSEPTKNVTPIGSKAWYDEQAVEIWEKEREKLIANSGEWPEEGNFPQ
jgi:hypothetical protein